MVVMGRFYLYRLYGFTVLREHRYEAARATYQHEEWCLELSSPYMWLTISTLVASVAVISIKTFRVLRVILE